MPELIQDMVWLKASYADKSPDAKMKFILLFVLQLTRRKFDLLMMEFVLLIQIPFFLGIPLRE